MGGHGEFPKVGQMLTEDAAAPATARQVMGESNFSGSDGEQSHGPAGAETIDAAAAAAYIAEMVAALHDLAARAHLTMLAQLLHFAHEEARRHMPPAKAERQPFSF